MLEILNGYATDLLHGFCLAAGFTLGAASISKLMGWAPINVTLNVDAKHNAAKRINPYTSIVTHPDYLRDGPGPHPNG